MAVPSISQGATKARWIDDFLADDVIKQARWAAAAEVVGETDDLGVDVKDSPFDERNLFATIFSALGIDPHSEYDLPNFPTFHRVEEQIKPIREVLI